MKSFGQAAKRRQIKDAVRGEMVRYTEHYDLCMLRTLHEEGYGAKRLRRFYRRFIKTYKDFQRRYYDKDDMKIFGSRSDTYALKESLKEIGFDFDEEVKKLEVTDEQAD